MDTGESVDTASQHRRVPAGYLLLLSAPNARFVALSGDCQPACTCRGACWVLIGLWLNVPATMGGNAGAAQTVLAPIDPGNTSISVSDAV